MLITLGADESRDEHEDDVDDLGPDEREDSLAAWLSTGRDNGGATAPAQPMRRVLAASQTAA